MKTTSNYIKAFTILEIVISLAIMSIIISMVYVIYGLLSGQMYDYSQQTDAVNQYNQFQAVFKRDLFNATQLIEGEDYLELYSSKDTLTYTLVQDRLVRSSLSRTDTFSLAIGQFTFLDSNLEESQYSTVKKLRVTYNLLGEQIEAVYFKQFGLASVINRQFFENGN